MVTFRLSTTYDVTHRERVNDQETTRPLGQWLQLRTPVEVVFERAPRAIDAGR